MKNYYYDLENKKVITLEELREDYDLLSKSDGFSCYSFEEYIETSVDWQDIVPLDYDELKALETETCFYNKNESQFMTESDLFEVWHDSRTCSYCFEVPDTFTAFMDTCTPWNGYIMLNDVPLKMALSKEKSAELAEKMTALKKTFIELNTLINTFDLPGHKSVYDYVENAFCENYPFSESFEELTAKVADWCDVVVESI